MATAVGYNIAKSKEVMEQIVNQYCDLIANMDDEFQGISATLQREWIGEDEQSFEQELAKRFDILQFEAYNLASNCVHTIGGLAQAWFNFQKMNVLEGGSYVGEATSGIEIPEIPEPMEGFFTANIITFDASTDRGLASVSSATTIKDAISTAVNTVRKKINNICENVNVSGAFFGDQVSSINTYVEKVGIALGEVMTAIKDMYDQIDKLAGSQYNTTIQNQINEQFTQASSDLDSSLDSIGSSRWN